jgi:hypothetical protein
VLHSIRNLIVDYLQAGRSVEKVIENATNNIFILSENPAFLQAVRPELLNGWLKQLCVRLGEVHFVRAVFAYIYREQLIKIKLPKWARSVNKKPDKMAEELKANYTFSLCINTEFRPKVWLVPLMTSSIPFYMAIADEDKNGMFCRSTELDPDVKKWRLRGFSTFDPHITAGLKDVFSKFLQLNAAVYTYTCDGCQGKTLLYNRSEKNFVEFDLVNAKSDTKIFLFDHDLLVLDFDRKINMTDLGLTPEIKCPACSKSLKGNLEELKDIPEHIMFNSKLAQFIGVENPKDLLDKTYNVGKALFWMIMGEEWKD